MVRSEESQQKCVFGFANSQQETGKVDLYSKVRVKSDNDDIIAFK